MAGGIIYSYLHAFRKTLIKNVNSTLVDTRGWIKKLVGTSPQIVHAHYGIKEIRMQEFNSMWGNKQNLEKQKRPKSSLQRFEEKVKEVKPQKNYTMLNGQIKWQSRQISINQRIVKSFSVKEIEKIINHYNLLLSKNPNSEKILFKLEVAKMIFNFLEEDNKNGKKA